MAFVTRFALCLSLFLGFALAQSTPPTSCPVSPSGPPVCQPLAEPPYAAPEGSTWIWNAFTCSWVLSSQSAPCPSPTYAPPGAAPANETWEWSVTQCGWVPVSTPGTPQSCTGPTGPNAQPPGTPPAGFTWNWDNTACSWILVPVPGYSPVCIPSTQPEGAPPLGFDWEWIPQYCSFALVSAYPTSESPIVIDTDGTGFHMTSLAGGVLFDFYGVGTRAPIAWTAAGSTNGWLALDRNGNGTIDSAYELFGNITAQPVVPGAAPNGFLALGVFDTPEAGGNGDGVIDKHDEVWSKLLVWIDANHDGISQPGELHHLDDLGVHSIELKYKESRYTDQYGNTFRYKGRLNPVHPDTVNRVIYDVFLLDGK